MASIVTADTSHETPGFDDLAAGRWAKGFYTQIVFEISESGDWTFDWYSKDEEDTK